MDKPDSGNDGHRGQTQESPQQHDLHRIFDAACQITAPFFDVKQSWGGASLTMYARQALREAYPELSQQEIAILFSSVARFHKTPPKNPR